jgi:predicted PurR-regulated permease PerM
MPPTPHPQDPAGTAGAPWLSGPGIPLTILASAALVFMCHWGSDVLIPIALAIFISYVLSPPVGWLKRRLRIPLALGATLVMLLVLGTLGAGIVALQPQAGKLLDTIPEAARKLDRQLRRNALDKESAVARMKEAAAELERAASSATNSDPRPAKPKAAAPQPESRVERLLAIGTARVIIAGVNAVVVISLVFLLLVTGDTFKRKLVRASGETLRQRKITVEILQEIEQQVSRYLFAHVATSALLGVLSWIVFAWMGLENAVFWGVAAGVLHLVPYLGPALTMGLTGLVAYLQFDQTEQVALVMGSQLVLASVIGMIVMPWITGRMTSINVVAIFVSLLFWGWLWGAWGLLLGVPIMMTVKAICERTDGLQAIAELLGREPPPREKAPPPAPEESAAAPT